MKALNRRRIAADRSSYDETPIGEIYTDQRGPLADTSPKKDQTPLLREMQSARQTLEKFQTHL